MMTRLSKRGQAVSGEYVVSVFIVVGALMLVSVFIKRTFQARARDITAATADQASKVLGKKVSQEYEPYYTASAANTDTATGDTVRFGTFAGNAIFNQTTNMSRGTQGVSAQCPPEMIRTGGCGVSAGGQ